MSGDPLQDDFYQLTGQVIRGWAKTELLLSQWLGDLLEIDELRSRIIWDSYGSFGGKVNLLRMLVRNFTDDALWEKANAILIGVEKIAENRYILPHAFGEVDEDRGKLSFYSERPDGDFLIDFTRERSVDTQVLKRWLQDIDDIQLLIAMFELDLAGGVHQESLLKRRAPASSTGAV